MRTRLLPVFVFLFCLALLPAVGCRTAYDLEKVRARAEEMSERILEAMYTTDAFGDTSRLQELTAEYPDLADPDLARAIAKKRDAESDPRLRKQLDYLFYDIAGTVVWRDLASYDDRIADAESGGVVNVGDEDIAYRDLGLRLYNETDSGLRERYYMAMGEFDVRETNPIRRERVEREREKLREFGYEDLDQFEAARRGLDHDALEETIIAFLDETKDIYWELTSDAAMEIFGVPATDIRDYDRGRLFRGAEFDQYFPKERTLPLLRETLLGLGIDLDQTKAITIDDEDRPEKEPRAATYGIKPGQDVRVLTKPAGGVDDYEALYHEMGHALHDAFVRATEYEFQRLGDYGTTETYAFVMEGLFSDPGFLEANGLVPDGATRKEFLKKQLLSDLASARYYAADFRYERLLHRGGTSDAELIEAYRDLMTAARLVPLEHPEFGYLSSNEDFYGVNYLEAWFLSAQLRAALRERFGEEWWSRPEAGSFLEELWGYGAELSPSEIARRLGYGGVDSRHFIDEVKRAYSQYR
jgi:oligoendopeptidase F